MLGLIIGGEELHNNHHADPANPKLSKRWFEFDIGWTYIKIFEALKLVEIRKHKRD
jgi:stearoyl-CoA desaturase (delta-9 desaturase)